MRADIDWLKAAKIGLADAVVWIWFLQTAYDSLFNAQVSKIVYFLPEAVPYSAIACLLVSAFLIATKWDAVPRAYRIACAIGGCVSSAGLLLVSHLGLFGTAFELLAFLAFVVFYYGSQVLRIETLSKCPDLRTLLVAVAVSFVLYYFILLGLFAAPEQVYTCFIVLAPLAFLFNASNPEAEADPPNPRPWKSLINPSMPLLLLFGIAGGLISASGGSNPATALESIFDSPSPVYLAMVLSYMVLGIVVVFGYRLRKTVFFTIMSVLWMAGSFLGSAILMLFPFLSPIAFTVAAAIIGIAIIVSFAARQDIWIKEPGSKDDRAENIDSLARKHGLTQRETEVFSLLMDGRSVPFIQKKLYISEGTARTHVKHIYAKLDVHSKQELLDLLH